MMYQLVLCIFACLVLQTWASPLLIHGLEYETLQRRTDPYFPAEPESCPICAKDYDSIKNCAEAAPVLQNFTMVIFNPGAFLDTIQCACAETFKAVFPQCADCFTRTGQDQVLMGHDLPAVVKGVREVCLVASTILGNVTDTNNDPTKAKPSSTSSKFERILSIRSTLVLVGLSVVVVVASL